MKTFIVVQVQHKATYYSVEAETPQHAERRVQSEELSPSGERTYQTTHVVKEVPNRDKSSS